ncbi:helix-turn-helix domain-containing protein [Actinomyces urogenitalis]|uniref:helix-turn-helix domain-containing protein n=1 Tax=Actinomyces urogenitalis TaxID=103621 RepID=UPI00242B1D7C|nr:helix-turn-helix domain-containing protein [Actinomyces urogenitalis]MCI7456348.1 helix-turn-helix domain-containing protein [Actinomyces urogenitalis]
MEQVSWRGWLEELQGLSPTEHLVAGELARLADWRGGAIASTTYLMTTTGRSRRAVFYALGELERRGVIVREQRRSRRGRRQGATRYRLVEAVSTPATTGSQARHVVGLDVVSSEGEVVSPDDDERLREMIAQAASQGWQGSAAQVLARTVMVEASGQFAAAVRRAQDLGGMSRDEAVLDTATRAWEALVGSSDAIVRAARPWAWWTTIVARVSYELDDRHALAVDPHLMPEEGLRPGGGAAGSGAFGIEDFEERLTLLVEALIEAGMDETVAWAGTQRLIEVAMVGASRRHTAAAIDPRLADLGIGGQCARAWMTLLAGSRRGSAPSILGMDEAELASRAADVVQMWVGQKIAA